MKRSEMPEMAAKVARPTARVGMIWVERATQGKRYVGHGIDPKQFDAAVKLLGAEKVSALANRALGIEEKELISALVKSGKNTEAQEKVYGWKPEAVKTRQPRTAPTVTVPEGKKTFTHAEVMKMLADGGIKAVTA